MLYSEYQKEIEKDIAKCFEEMKSQPIIFIGSGFSRRYFNSPNWIGLLEEVYNKYKVLDKDFRFYSQKFNRNEIKIADAFIEPFQEWAWTNGKELFSKELFDTEVDKAVFLKASITKFLEDITPESLEEIENPELKEELKVLKKVVQHAIITTNYDNFLEKLFPEHVPIIGQQILKTNFGSIGEIYKIHGCVSDPNSLVLVSKDYEEFKNKKKYLSAKLFTYFVEHPLFFIGYSANDPDIKEILSDIDELLNNKKGVIPNIYIVTWDKDLESEGYFDTTKGIFLEDGKEIKIKNIVTKDYLWIFKALSKKTEIENINIKILRSLMARVYTLVRTDIPSNKIEVSYQTLEGAVSTNEGIPKLLGLTLLSNPADINAAYPYTLTGIAKRLGYTTWHKADQLLKKVAEEKEYDIKKSDNKYHVQIKLGTTGHSDKYSEKCYELLLKVKNGEEYNVER